MKASNRLWWIRVVDPNGMVRANPVFLAKAETWQEAVAKVEANFDREEYGRDVILDPQIVEFGEVGPDVACL